MNRLLMCPPDFFEIRYEINPWMNRAQTADYGLAIVQWTRLHDTLDSLGCEVEWVRPQPGWPDMVFTANAGLVCGRRYICGNFRHRERQGESPWFEQWFAEEGYEIIRLAGHLAFEGEGDALFCGGRLFCGHGFRTDELVHCALGASIGLESVSLKLVDSWFYHLDTCFCPLGGNRAAWFPGAFDEASQEKVRDFVTERIEVSREEAGCFACNAVVLERDIVLPEGCPVFCAELTARGSRCHALPMGEFIKAGGACKCLVLRLASL